MYEVLPKISENFNILRRPLALRTCSARCLLLYLSTVSHPTGIFISACVSEFWLFSLHHFHVCLLISKWRTFRSKRFCIKFCFKLNKTATETHQMLKEAFGEQALSQARTFEWFKHFKDGQESVEDDKRSGTTLEMIAKVRDVILEDRRQTIHNVCNRVGLSYRSCQRILADEMNMRRIAAKFVPCLLNSDQRDHRVQVCTMLEKAVRRDPNFLSRVITGDESGLYDYDPGTKQQSSQWKTPFSPRLKKVHQVHSNMKSVLIIFFLTFEELCIRSLFHLVRLSMGSFTARF